MPKKTNGSVPITSKISRNHINGNINHELHIDSNFDECSDYSSPQVRKLIKLESPHEYQKVNNLIDKHSRSKSSKTSSSDDTNSDEEEAAEFPMTGSMVRSNTFDLEKQNSLEDAAIDDSIEWCYRGTSNNKTENGCEKSIEAPPPRRADSTGFFLHDHSPSPKSNIFKGTFVKEPSFNSSQELESASVHFRRLDGSMSDSGFMSHSTFSLMSDAGYTNSVASSLIMSSDGITCSPVSVTMGSDTSGSLSERTKQLSGSMFPFYIDINNLPPPTPDSAKGKKSPSHTYMYIDARNPNGSTKSNQPYLNTSYEEFFSGIEEHDEKEPLVKAQSTSRLDAYRTENKLQSAAELNEKLRPQSCYMFVDLDSMQFEAEDKRSESKMSNQEPAAVSMFIDLNNRTKDHIPSRVNDDIARSSELDLQIRDPEKKLLDREVKISNGTCIGDQKRKLSDSFFSANPNFENKVNFFSLIKHRDSKSATSLNHQMPYGHEIFPQFKNQSTRKSKSAHRYSDGIYYDNLYEKKFSHNGSNSLNRRICMDPKSYQNKDMKAFDPTFRLIQCSDRNEDASGSCSNLGKMSFTNKLLLDDKVKWKSTGDMEKPKCVNSNENNSGLLPMSPILRRKSQTQTVQEQPSPPIIVKASTKPQDIDAMKFPKPLKEETSKLNDISLKDDTKLLLTQSQSPSRQKNDDSKSSSDSLKLGSDGPSESSDTKLKKADSMSRSGSSLGDSSSDKQHPIQDSSGKGTKRTNSPTTSLAIADFEDDSETIYSEVSDVSSSLGGLGGVASLERHWRESQNNQHVSVSNQNVRNDRQMLEACSKLGEDLLKMFLEEIDTDIVVEVEGRQIKAHR